MVFNYLGKKWGCPSELDIFVLYDAAYNNSNDKTLEIPKTKSSLLWCKYFFSYGDKIINVNFSVELLSAFFFNG